MGDSLGDRMKSYEAVTRSVLIPRSYTILRVDGRAFHSYLSDAKKPFDELFIQDMQHVGAELCRGISGSVLAYGQSDEISVLISDVKPPSQMWFGGVVQKMASVSASIATVALIERRGWNHKPQFDARVFTLPSIAEVENYFIWRQRDAIRNSVSMAAQHVFSANQLHGKNSDQMQDMIWEHHNINWDDYPGECKRGWIATKGKSEVSMTYIDKRTQTEETVHGVVRSFWETTAAPHFASESQFFQPLIAA